MAYYFMVEEKRGKYEPIVIDGGEIYSIPKRQYVKKGAYGLKEIDMFTTLFNNETELRQALLNEGLLKPEFKDKPLSIRFYSKNVYSKLRHDLLYQKDLEYILNPDLVWKFVIDRFKQEDYQFIEKLATYFLHYHECASTANEVMHGALHSLHSGKKHEILERFDLNGDLLVSRLVKLIIYKSFTSYQGYTVYKEVNHRNLHSLIAFINNYYKDEPPKVEMTKPKTKTRTKEVEGQLKMDI